MLSLLWQFDHWSGNFLMLWVQQKERMPTDCKLVQPLGEIVWRFLRKLNVELRCDPAIPLLGMYLDKTIIQKIYMYPAMFIAALFTIAKTWKQPNCPLQMIKKMWYICTMEYYFNHIKEGNKCHSQKYGCN